MSEEQTANSPVTGARIEAFYETIVSSMKSGLAIIGPDHTLTFANDSFYEFYDIAKDNPEPIALEAILPATVAHGFDVCDRVRNLRPGDSSLEFRGLKLHRSPDDERTINVHASPIISGDERSVLLLIDNVTASAQRSNQVSMINKIGEMMQGTLDLDRLLHVVLTCVTAGSGLGFSRAMLMMVSEDGERLEGKMAVGPSSQEEAARIWSLMANENKPFEELIADGNESFQQSDNALNRMVRSLTLSIFDYSEVAVVTALEKRVHIVRNGTQDPRVSESFIDRLGTDEFVIVPIVSRDNAVGVIVADNKYSSYRIDDEAVELLTLFANQAGLAIENAKTYESLKEQMAKLRQAYLDLSEAQDKLVRSERLAAIGEMAARVAHEIRNPLVTIGGFARSLRKYHNGPQPCAEHNQEKVRRELDIVIEEVMSLEEILAKVIDFSRPDTPLLRLGDLNRVLDDTADLLSAGTPNSAVVFKKTYATDLPMIYFDLRQIRQVFFNLLQNAMDAMPEGGAVTISTVRLKERVVIEVKDEGEGIAPMHMSDLFSPFFTTKISGTGLGLPVVKKIVMDHGGEIRVESEPGNGTKFIVTLPIVTTLPKGDNGTEHE